LWRGGGEEQVGREGWYGSDLLMSCMVGSNGEKAGQSNQRVREKSREHEKVKGALGHWSRSNPYRASLSA
jgi:hypothetical protein